MSVIAKLSLNAIRDFGAGALYELSCVCQDDLMAEYAGSEEDKLFTRFSPWGEARIHLRSGAQFPQAHLQDAFYAMMVPKAEGREGHPDGAWLSSPARIASMTDFGGSSRQVEICNSHDVPVGNAIANFNWRMSVDNPAASDQLVPGSDGWTFSLWNAGDFTRDAAIAAAIRVG